MCRGPCVSPAVSLKATCCLVFFSFSLLTLLSTWAELIMGSCLWPTHLACLPPAAAHWPSFLPLLKVVALSFSLLDCWATWIPWTCPRTALKYLSVWVAWSAGKREQQKNSECASKKRSVRVCGFPPYPWSPEPPSPYLYILHRGVCSLPFLPSKGKVQDPLPCTYIFSTVVLQINFWTLSESALQSVLSALTIWWYDDGTSESTES